MNHATIRPAQLRFHSTDLSCQVVRGIGFRAVCACGYRGQIRESHAQAAIDRRAHVCNAVASA